MSLGIIGGMGPMATAVFYEKIVNITGASRDQDHIDTIIYSCPQIPDRTSFFLGRSNEDPYPVILGLAKRLEEQGVSVIAIPCVTAAYFEKALGKDIPVPVLNGIRETALLLKSKGYTSAGIMATEGSIRNRLIASALEENGILPVEPDAEYQDTVSDIIYGDVKAGKPVDTARLCKVADHLRDKGAGAIILGCTELSVIAHMNELTGDFYDILDVLAAESVKACGKDLKVDI